MVHDEYLDIVDENDVVIGKDLRNKIYKEGRAKNTFLRFVNILAFDKEGFLLLPKRSMNRRLAPGCYDFSCGEHMTAGEEYYPAAIRGVEEELGIKNAELEFLGKLEPADNVTGFMHIYKVIVDDRTLDYDKKGIERLEWHSIDETIKMIDDNPSIFKNDVIIVLKWYDLNFV